MRRTDPTREGAPASRPSGETGRVYSISFAAVWREAVGVARGTKRWTVTREDPAEGILWVEATHPILRGHHHFALRVSLDEQGFTRVDVGPSRGGAWRNLGIERRRSARFLHRLDRRLLETPELRHQPKSFDGR